MTYLIKKVAKDNMIDNIDDINQITNKISVEQIQENIEFLKNMKKK